LPFVDLSRTHGPFIVYHDRDSQFHDDLRKLLLAEFDFTGMSVDESLRDLLETFELPKESQQIDRIVGAFAQKYHEDNSDVFENAGQLVVRFASEILKSHCPFTSQTRHISSPFHC